MLNLFKLVNADRHSYLVDESHTGRLEQAQRYYGKNKAKSFPEPSGPLEPVLMFPVSVVLSGCRYSFTDLGRMESFGGKKGHLRIQISAEPGIEPGILWILLTAPAMPLLRRNGYLKISIFHFFS